MPKIDSYFRSDIGKKRANNEDNSGAFEPQDPHELDQSGRLFIVADGLGGHQQGEKASSFAVETLLKVYYEAPEIPPEKRLHNIITQINQKLIEYSEKNLPRAERTGTTLVTAVVRKGKLLIANVGDSRAYLVRDGRIKQITRDHSLVAEMVRAGTLSEAEARESKYRNRLSRSVGGSADLEVDIHPPISLRRGDIILLCTDGLTGYASEKDILQATYGNSKDIAERLISLANDRGGADNITASVIRYGEPLPLPIGLPRRKLAWVSAGIITLAAFAFLGWFGASRGISIFATPTQTASFTFTASPSGTAFPTSTFTPTLNSAQNLTTSISETLSPTVTQTLTPPLATDPPVNSDLVDCEYMVLTGEYVYGIAGKFDATREQIFRIDGTQEEMSSVLAGEKLIIKGITVDVCIQNNGAIHP